MPGWVRLKYVVYENRIASGTYSIQNWEWRDGNYGHDKHMHISFTTIGETDPAEFQIPMLYGVSGTWDGHIPYYDILLDASKSGAKNLATWRLACRLAELGFYEGKPLPEGKQGFPVKAIQNMQEYMGWTRLDYCPKVHKGIWKELTLSGNTP
jgi:hypothetical protein